MEYLGRRKGEVLEMIGDENNVLFKMTSIHRSPPSQEEPRVIRVRRIGSNVECILAYPYQGVPNKAPSE